MRGRHQRLLTVVDHSVRRWIRSAVFVLAAIAACAHGGEPARRANYERGILIRLDGMVSPLLEQFLYRKLDAARELGADLLIFQIDSPGGFLDSSLEIAERLRDLKWARTVAYVPSEALSGAAIVALACDEIVMAPAARLGDAGPIIQGEDSLFRHAPEKIRSELAGRLRDLAIAKGRPPSLAAAMADMDLVVYRVHNKQTGADDFCSDEDLANKERPEDWEKQQMVPESRPKYFLSVNGERAVELKLAQATAASLEDLKKRYGVPGDLLVLRATAIDTAVTILNMPIVTGVLFVIGLIALYVEFSAPGIGMGGLIAGLCFALFFWSRFLGGTAGWLEVVLFIVGIAFLAVEIFIIPGFGIAGLTGLLLIFASILMASQHFVLPHSAIQWQTSMQSVVVLASSGLLFLVAAGLLSHYFNMLPVVRSLVLETPGTAADSSGLTEKGAKIGANEQRRYQLQAGDWGIADSQLRPAGKARFGEHYVDVVADGLFVEKGRPIRIIEVSGNRVVVREIESEA